MAGTLSIPPAQTPWPALPMPSPFTGGGSAAGRRSAGRVLCAAQAVPQRRLLQRPGVQGAGLPAPVLHGAVCAAQVRRARGEGCEGERVSRESGRGSDELPASVLHGAVCVAQVCCQGHSTALNGHSGSGREKKRVWVRAIQSKRRQAGLLASILHTCLHTAHALPTHPVLLPQDCRLLCALA